MGSKDVRHLPGCGLVWCVVCVVCAVLPLNVGGGAFPVTASLPQASALVIERVAGVGGRVATLSSITSLGAGSLEHCVVFG